MEARLIHNARHVILCRDPGATVAEGWGAVGSGVEAEGWAAAGGSCRPTCMVLEAAMEAEAEEAEDSEAVVGFLLVYCYFPAAVRDSAEVGSEGVAAEAAAVREEVAATAAAGSMSKARYVSIGCSL